MTKFKIGKICNKHPELLGKRYESTGKCTECEIIRRRIYYAANTEKEKAYNEVYRKKNAAKLRALDTAWAKRNPDKKIAASLKWARENPDKKNAAVAARKASQIKATPGWANLDYINGMYELCALFRKIGIDMHIDHIVPLKSKLVCGLHVEDNLQLMTRSENSSKGNRWWPDMP
jgi:5-methylcytosine-specific restriction endonuclease McrA